MQVCILQWRRNKNIKQFSVSLETENCVNGRKQKINTLLILTKVYLSNGGEGEI